MHATLFFPPQCLQQKPLLLCRNTTLPSHHRRFVAGAVCELYRRPRSSVYVCELVCIMMSSFNLHHNDNKSCLLLGSRQGSFMFQEEATVLLSFSDFFFYLLYNRKATLENDKKNAKEKRKKKSDPSCIVRYCCVVAGHHVCARERQRIGGLGDEVVQ